jgi:isoquinoline 1-oxidoreductase beta subunit
MNAPIEAGKPVPAGTGRSRRRFLIDAAVAGGGLAIGMSLPGRALAAAGTGNAPAFGATAAGAEVTVWVVVQPDDTCVVRIARSEMGQGTLTGLAQLVAEELRCDWAKVKTEFPTPGQSLARKRAWGEMGTGGSRGIRTSEDYVRRGAAAARLMLLQAAADGWQVPVAELSVDRGVISHVVSGRTVRYGQVAGAAARLTPPDPKSITLRKPADWTIAGRPLNRLDTAPKLDGSKIFGVDLVLPGMLFAAIRDCPVFGGKVASIDESAIARRAGVKRVVRVGDTAVAVVADTWWRAKSALAALPITWDERGFEKRSSATIDAQMKEGLDAPNAFVYRNEGDATAAIAGAVTRIEADYGTPFLAHATMEPMNTTARVTADRAEAWVPTQNGEASHASLAEATGLPLDRCEIYKMDPGGGFGRRGGNQDYVRQAAIVAKAFPGVPVKLIWSREEDMQHDFYRPISQCRLSAGLDASGNLTGLRVRLAGQSINAFINPGSVADGRDERQVQGWYDKPGDAQFGYTVPNLRIEYAMRNSHVPVGPWRGVNTNQNGIYMECFIEEVARAAKADSYEFRRRMMGKHPRHLGVLDAAAARAGWGSPLPAGVHRGIAQFMGYGSYSAAVAEVSVGSDGLVKVHRLVFALNCGHAVNPSQIAAQVEGSVAYGLSATFYGECTVEQGRIVQSNFHDYPILRLAQMPRVETVILPTNDFWGGVGEPTICVVAPAVMNAIFAATGKPVRTLPLRKHGLA